MWAVGDLEALIRLSYCLSRLTTRLICILKIGWMNVRRHSSSIEGKRYLQLEWIEDSDPITDMYTISIV